MRTQPLSHLARTVQPRKNGGPRKVNVSIDVSSIKSIADTGEGLVAVTTDEALDRKDVPLRDFLRRIREAFDVDVVFVSQFIDGRRVFRAVDCNPDDEFVIAEKASDPLEESYCFHVVEGRLPQVIPDTALNPLAMSIPGTRAARVGCHLSVPIVGSDGMAFGTVCCFSHHPTKASAPRSRWRHCAALPRCWRTLFVAEIASRRAAGPFRSRCRACGLQGTLLRLLQLRHLGAPKLHWP